MNLVSGSIIGRGGESKAKLAFKGIFHKREKDDNWS